MRFSDKEKEIIVAEFVAGEEGLMHPSYDTELEFYQMVCEGNISALKSKKDYGDIDKKDRGLLSSNPVNNLRYHIIVTIAMITRHCIEAGLAESESYKLSDYYIRRADECPDIKGLKKLHKEIVFDYAGRMQNLQKNAIDSIHCIKAVDYIKAHLHAPISLSELSDYVGLERTYFCKHFHQVMKIKVSDYIRNQRLIAAKNMLLYSDYSCSEIAEFLAFPSASSMGAAFKKMTGQTPSAYRLANYRKHYKSSTQ